MRIAFVTNDFRRITRFGTKRLSIGGAGYYRCVLPARGLAEFGQIDAQCFPDATVADDGEIVPLDERKIPHPGFDVIVLQRWMLPTIAEVTKQARALGQLVVQDVDDHFWAVHKANRAHRVMDVESSPGWNTDHYAEAMRAASLVTVSTPYLADVIRDLGQPNVAVLGNMIDLRHWQRQPIRDEVKLVGWVGTTLHRSDDLQVIGDALRRYLRGHPTVQVVHGGHVPGGPRASELLNVPTTKVLRRPTQPIDRYPKLWADLDLALCPLNPIPFNRAKSAIKAMEASAAGVPFVASDLDAYRAYGCGRLVTSPGEWRTALEDLTGSAALRRELADAAAARVLLDDVARRWADWQAVYQGEWGRPGSS